MTLRKAAILFAALLAIHTGAAAAPDGHDDRKEKRHEEPVSDKGRLKISGYLQPQFQWGEGDASLKVGTPNDNPSESFNRFGLRRGHLKFAYAYKTASAVVQIDVSTEKGVILKDAYIDVKEPWLRTFGLQAGVFNRPFGLEIELSSSVRESALPMVSSLAERLQISVAPAMACRVLGGKGAQRSSQISTASVSAGCVPHWNNRFVPKGTCAPDRSMTPFSAGAGVNCRFS